LGRFYLISTAISQASTVNATSVFYRYLCFYKIIESFYLRRFTLAKEAKSRGEKPRVYTEDVPLSPEAMRGISLWIYPWKPSVNDEFIINQILPGVAVGKRFKALRQELLESVKDTIAHGPMAPAKSRPVADRLEDIEKISK
jgi:hypothetical protein